MTILFSIISFMVGLVIVGVVAGFSFMLYATQVAVLGSKQAPLRKGLALAIGVASGMVILALLFLLLQPETFHVISVWELIDGYRTNMIDSFIGLLCIVCGIYLVLLGQRRKGWQLNSTPRPSASIKKQKGSSVALFSFGFGRAVTRVTGIAALLLGVRTIIYATDDSLLRLLFLMILLAAAMLPYVIILAAKVWRPSLFLHIENYLAKVKNIRPYRTVGVFLVVVGAMLVLLSLLPV